MRKLFWILLLANAILFAGMQQGWFARQEQAVVQGLPLHEEMIRLQEVTQAAPARPQPPVPAASVPAPPPAPATPAPAPSATPAPASTPAATSDLHLSMTMAEPAGTDQNAPICLEWGDFSGADLTRAEIALAALQLNNQINKHQIERDIGYWVYIPPLKNKAAVNRKIGELKDLGIHEYFVVQNAGRWRNAISLGVFKTRDAAQNFLNHLRTKGVHSARVGERTSKLVTTVFTLNGTDAATGGRMAAIQKDFPGSELKNVPCTH